MESFSMHFDDCPWNSFLGISSVVFSAALQFLTPHIHQCLNNPDEFVQSSRIAAETSSLHFRIRESALACSGESSQICFEWAFHIQTNKRIDQWPSTSTDLALFE